MRKEIRRIDPLRLGLVYVVMILLVWPLTLIGQVTLIWMLPLGSLTPEQAGWALTLIDLGFSLVLVVALGFLGGYLTAVLYNLAARMVGGVVVEWDDG